MKKILLPAFILLSTVCFGQAPIALDTVNNACHIDKIGFAKDNMTYTLYGDSSINLFIVGAASYQNTHYSRFRDPGGNPFQNRTALTNWIDLYFFANALADSTSGGGGDTATLQITTDAGNATTNAIQITGNNNLNNLIGGIKLAYNPVASTVSIFNPDTYSSAITFTPINGQLFFTTTNNTGSSVYTPLTLMPDATGSSALAGLFNGRLQASRAVDTADIPTWGQVQSQNLALGETSTTAYRGDRGKAAYDHSQITGGANPHNTTFANIASLPTTVAGYGITNAAILGGNTLGAEPVIGSTDNFALSFKVNNSIVAKVVSSGIISGGGVQNLASAGSSRVLTQSTGVLIDRNVNDANSLVKFNYINASGTGLTIDCQKAGVTNFSVSNLGSATALSFIKTGGTSNQFLKADGSIDANSYVVGSLVGTLKSGSVTLTSDGLVVTFMVDHNFGSTGYEVSLTPTSVLSASPCYVVNKQANTFQIQFVTAPAVGSPSFDWIIHKN
jgi:hypothetical protein